MQTFVWKLRGFIRIFLEKNKDYSYFIHTKTKTINYNIAVLESGMEPHRTAFIQRVRSTLLKTPL